MASRTVLAVAAGVAASSGAQKCSDVRLEAAWAQLTTRLCGLLGREPLCGTTDLVEWVFVEDGEEGYGQARAGRGG